MTLEQTTQLVQLILNAAIMVVASGIMLGVAMMHQIRLEKKRRSSPHSLPKPIRQTFRRQARRVTRSIFYLNVACLTLITSTGLLALRTLVNQSLLISLSLFSFAVGCLVFLIGVGLFFLSIRQPRRPQSVLKASPTLDKSANKSANKSAKSNGIRKATAKITPLNVSTAASNLVVLRDRSAR